MHMLIDFTHATSSFNIVDITLYLYYLFIYYKGSVLGYDILYFCCLSKYASKGSMILN